MQRADETEVVLRAYAPDCRPHTVEPLGNAGGFSGASFWRLTARRGTLCLRRWPPEHPSPERLDWIHRVVAFSAANGFDLFPAPIATLHGDTYCEHQGCLWELTPWMPGEATYWRDPRPEKLRSALAALARFHHAAQSFPGSLRDGAALHSGRCTFSPGIVERLNQTRRLLGGGIKKLQQATAANRNTHPRLAEAAQTLFSLVAAQLPWLEKQLLDASQIEVAVQPCLRDIWHDHVLFLGDQVSGVVDLGAMRVESVAADLSRLLGSLCRHDAKARSIGLSAYEELRPLTPAEKALVPAFDRSQLPLAGINWVEWVFVERRNFSDPDAVMKRMEHILTLLAGGHRVMK